MGLSSPRIPPLSPERFTAEQARLAGKYAGFNFARVLVQHPDVYRHFIPFGERLMSGSILPLRDREILVLRTLALCHETYEAGHHGLIARNVGMSQGEIEAAQTGSDAGLSSFDRALVSAATELVRDCCVSEETWQILAKGYSQAQLMEVVFLVGNYVMSAMLTRSFGMQAED